MASVSAGWQHELRSLRHYLQRHRGRDRVPALAQVVTPLSARDVWKRLLSPAAFSVSSGSLVEGQPCVLETSIGDRFSGIVQLYQPEWDLAMTVENLRDGLLRLSTWRGGGRTGVHVWLATYDPTLTQRVQEFQHKAEELLKRIVAS